MPSRRSEQHADEVTPVQARLGVDPSSGASSADDPSVEPVDAGVDAELEEAEPVRDDDREPVEQPSVYETRGVLVVRIEEWRS